MTTINRKVFWPAVAIGWAAIGWGLIGLFENSSRTNPSQWVRWFVGSLVVHDLILAPAVIGVGVLLARWVPVRHRGPVQGALIITGILVLVFFPFVRGYGLRDDNPSALPNDYGMGLIIVIALTWLGAGVVLWHRRARKGGEE